MNFNTHEMKTEDIDRIRNEKRSMLKKLVQVEQVMVFLVVYAYFRFYDDVPSIFGVCFFILALLTITRHVLLFSWFEIDETGLKKERWSINWKMTLIGVFAGLALLEAIYYVAQ